MKYRTLHYIIRFLVGEEAPSELVEAVGYTSDPNKFSQYKVVIIPSGFFNDEVYGTSASAPQLPLKEIHGVPLLFGSNKEEWIGNTWVVHADIIASTYFLISRYEEMIHRELRDEHGRFPGKESLPYRAGFIDRPIVDEYRFILHRWLRQARMQVPEIKKDFKNIYLTHDVDAPTLYRSWKGLIRSIMDGKGLIRSIKAKFGDLENDPYYTFPWLFEQDQKARAKFGDACIHPILFIKSGGKNKHDKPHYELRNNDIKKLIASAKDHDITIGLHSSYEAGTEPTLVAKEKARLERHIEKEVLFNRHHYLSIREPEDMLHLEGADLSDDFTMGYADVSGFRLGTCYPVRWINPITRRLSPLVLHPLTIMDCTLEEEKYMGLDYDKALAYCKRLIAQVRKVGGELTLLWHNDTVTEEGSSYYRKIYGKLIEDLMQDDFL